MSVLAQGPESQGIILSKGAPESILQRCSHVSHPLTPLRLCLYAPAEKDLLQSLEELLYYFEGSGPLFTENPSVWKGTAVSSNNNPTKIMKRKDATETGVFRELLPLFLGQKHDTWRQLCGRKWHTSVHETAAM